MKILIQKTKEYSCLKINLVFGKQFLILLILFITLFSCGQIYLPPVKTGAERTEIYFPLLEGKNVAIVSNHTSLVGDVHLVDSLLSAGINVIKVFCPEHGFRGSQDAGQEVNDQIDLKTGLSLISLYGKNKKPRSEDLKNVDIIIYDIQDVGARFYTYISTMTYVMKACAENNIPLMILDRPNPNGFYVDGPVLDEDFKSFVGMHPVPVVYGMTPAEYALMVNGEKWLNDGIICDLTIVKLENYDHKTKYKLPVKPSPNLPDMTAVYLYPSLCFFEGTVVSVGRGTDFPFQVIGHPENMIGSFIFTPRSIPGVCTHPKYEGVKCLGQNLKWYIENRNKIPDQINLGWLIGMFDFLNEKTEFFNDYFDKLAGSSKLRKQIEQGWNEEKIRESWQPEIDDFKKTRSKYLLYPDFE